MPRQITDTDLMGLVLDPERRGLQTQHPSSQFCPFIDSKTLEFCSLNGRMCPFVGFDYHRCEKFIQNQGKSTIGHQIMNDIEKLRTSNVQEKLTEKKKKKKLTTTKNQEIARAVKSIKKTDSDAEINDKMERVLYGVDPSLNVARNIEKQLQGHFTQINDGRVSTGFVHGLLANIFPALYQKLKYRTDVGDIDPDSAGEDEADTPTTTFKSKTYKTVKNQTYWNKKIFPTRARSTASSRTQSPKFTPGVKVGKTRTRSGSSKDNMTYAAFVHAYNSWDAQTKKEANDLHKGKYLAYVEKLPKHDRRVEHNFRRTANIQNIKYAQVQKGVIQAQANAFDNAVKMGIISPEFATRWKNNDKGKQALAKGMNKYFDRLARVEYKQMNLGSDRQGNKLVMPYVDIRSSLPHFTKNDIDELRMWDAYGMRLVSYYQQYGKGFGSFVTFIALLKSSIAPILIAFHVTPEIASAMQSWFPSGVFYNLYFWIKKQPPTMQMSRDTKRDVSMEIRRRPKTDTKWHEGPLPAATAALHGRSTPTTKQKWKRRTRKPYAQPRQASRDWGKSFNESWADDGKHLSIEES